MSLDKITTFFNTGDIFHSNDENLDRTTINDIIDELTGNTADISAISGDVITNTNDIANLSGDVTTNTTNINNLSGDVTTNTTNINNLSGDVATLSATTGNSLSGATNGLSVVDNQVSLGGSLTGNTTVELTGNTFTVEDGDISSIEIADSGISLGVDFNNKISTIDLIGDEINMRLSGATAQSTLDITTDYVKVSELNITNVGTGTSVNNLGVDSSGNVVVGSSSGAPVDSVNGETGTVVLTTGDISEDTNYNYVTDAELAQIANISGNTADIATLSARTDVHITGGTYASETLTLTDNEDNDITITGFTDGSGTITGATNGLSTSGSDIILGGSLTGDTTVDTTGHTLTMGDDQVSSSLDDIGGLILYTKDDDDYESQLHLNGNYIEAQVYTGTTNFGMKIETTGATFSESGSTSTTIIQNDGIVLTSPDGTQYKLTVDNSGNLSTTAV